MRVLLRADPMGMLWGSSKKHCSKLRAIQQGPQAALQDQYRPDEIECKDQQYWPNPETLKVTSQQG